MTFVRFIDSDIEILCQKRNIKVQLLYASIATDGIILKGILCMIPPPGRLIYSRNSDEIYVETAEDEAMDIHERYLMNGQSLLLHVL